MITVAALKVSLIELSGKALKRWTASRCRSIFQASLSRKDFGAPFFLERYPVPRLSLIVPFQCDSQALETTLLSVLEARSSDHELIVVHRGQYQDPYGLGGDEAVVVETASAASLPQQLNTAVETATGDVIQVVLPGTLLEPDWCNDALAAFDQMDIDLIALGVDDSKSKQVQYGFDSDSLPQRCFATEASKISGPLLEGTMIRRSVILGLGGWNTKIPADLIDFEMSLLVRVLGLHVGVVQDALVHCNEPRSMVLSHYELGRSIGQLACAFSEASELEISDAAISVEPLVKRLGHLASGLVNPKLAAQRLGWVLGVRDRSWVKPITNRIQNAYQALEQLYDAWDQEPSVLANPGTSNDARQPARKAA